MLSVKRKYFQNYRKPYFSTNTSRSYDYDVFVIGGGSGGLALAKEAAKHGKTVGLCDFVKPSAQNKTWGLGGTCVNVGCIPKKLMHQSGIIKELVDGAEPFGWRFDSVPKEVNWEALVESVQLHIKSLNFGYKNDLMSNDVKYLNQLASFVDNETVLLKNKKGEEKTITARDIVIAVGGRPTLPNIKGVEHIITSDEIFSLKSKPGKTLVVGASYIALECAGFLHKFGFDTSVMVRSIVLRGFDIQIAGIIENHMKESGIKFIGPSQPTEIRKLDDGRLEVHYSNVNGTSGTEIFDTVLYAIGRGADTTKLSLDKPGVKVEKNGKVIVDKEDRTSVSNIYAIGDCATGVPELTPVAIMAGKLLARRIANVSTETMNYKLVPTTVFTPIEYGTIGFTEEEASIVYGEKNIEVYHSFFQPLESSFDKNMEGKCYIKLICNSLDNERVVGFHLYSPNAGEVTQGFATAMMAGATKKDFEKTIGIHPTIAEEVVLVNTTKRENPNPTKTGC